jgi:iron complex outermembrane receptor protein
VKCVTRSDRQPSRPNTLLAGLALSLAATTSALAQTAAAPHPAPTTAAAKAVTVKELEIVGERANEVSGAAGDIKPDLQLTPEDVAAYGVSTITDLIDQLNPEIGGNSGRGGEGPAILINGRRISGFNEVRNIPTEAIQRVDILPEEAALTYGFSANQRVVNIVLKSSFGAQMVDLGGGASFAGGGASYQAETSTTRIAGERRFNLSLKYNRQDALTESDRNVTPLATDPTLNLAGGAADQRPYRTLQGKTDKTSLNAVYTQPIFAGIKATVNGTLETSDSDSLRGLPDVNLTIPTTGGPVTTDRFVTAFGPLAQDSRSWTGHLGVAFNRDVAKWRLALTGAYDHSDSRNENDADLNATALQSAITAGTLIVTPSGPIPATLLTLRPEDSGQSKSDTGNLTFVASGAVLNVPAGQVRTSFRAGASTSSFSSDSMRAGLSQGADFSRTMGSLQASIDLPLTSRSKKVFGALGDISLNTHFELEQVSDFGALQTIGYGVHWTPWKGLSILANQLHDEGAPTQQQLGGAILTTPGARLFDYVTGQTVDVTQISGGNPDLKKDDRNRTSVRVTWQPMQSQQLIIRADYNRIRYKNPITSFPAVTAQVEEAFPDRFVRDADGDLTQVDLRPVNFARQNVTSLKWGFDYSRPIGPKGQPERPTGVAAQLRQVLPRGAAGGGRPGAGGTGAGGQRGAQGAPMQRPGGAAFGGPPPEGAMVAGEGGAAGAPGATPGGEGGMGGPPGGGAPGGGFGGGGFAGGGPGGMGGGPGGGMGGGRGGGGGQDGRLRIAVFQTIYFDNEYLLAPGGPLLDFLNGASLGAGGGQPHQEIQAQINAAERGFGVELSANYKSGSTVRGGIGGASDDLDFSGVFKVNARLFADLNQRKELIEKAPWLKGSRITVSVSNLFNQRVEVKDASGLTPYSFQPAFIDPLGRTWRISFRKLFS